MSSGRQAMLGLAVFVGAIGYIPLWLFASWLGVLDPLTKIYIVAILGLLLIASDYNGY